jgi:methionine sulfoxide reductase heme-binding subunit
MTSSKELWYLTRGSGIVTLILLTVAVLAGLLTVGRWSSGRWQRFVIEGLHRNISLLSTVFLFVHIASSVLDKYVSITWLNAIVPIGGTYKPFWLGMGALSLDVFAAVAITSLIRVRLGYGAWRAVHWLAYGCFVLAVVHGLGIGSDRHQLWFLTLNLVAVGSVGVALAWRVTRALWGAPVATTAELPTMSPSASRNSRSDAAIPGARVPEGAVS